MFYKYKIVNNVLYLYVDDKYEIGSFFKSGKNGIKESIKEFLNKSKINFNGTKAVLIVSGIVLGSVILNTDTVKGYNVYNGTRYVYAEKILKELPNKKVQAENLKGETKQNIEINNLNDSKEINTIKNENKVTTKNINKNDNKINEKVSNTENIVNNEVKTNNVNKGEVKKEVQITETEKIITIKRSNGNFENIKLQDYLIGVVAAEMPASFNSEALKAQSVIARTYTFKLLEQGRTLTDDVSTQVYKDNNELKTSWGASYNTYYNKIKDAVLSTGDLTIKYNGKLIDAVYHSTSNGYTEDSVNVWNNSFPYLKSVSSPWDTSASSFLREETLSFDTISNKLGFNFNESKVIEVISRNESNRISQIRLGNNTYTGVEIRNLLGLRSADFDVQILDNSVKFTTRGYGHGVGLSQYGANGMANAGYSFLDIIKYYYSNVTIS